MEGFCGTLERWLEGVANDFVNRSSNGRTDGFNHGLRAVLWRAFDLRNCHAHADDDGGHSQDAASH